jgi:hypothetical protein
LIFCLLSPSFTDRTHARSLTLAVALAESSSIRVAVVLRECVDDGEAMLMTEALHVQARHRTDDDAAAKMPKRDLTRPLWRAVARRRRADDPRSRPKPADDPRSRAKPRS